MRILVLILKRLFWFVPTAAGLVAAVFFISRVIPSDPVALIAGETATKEQIAARYRAAWNRFRAMNPPIPAGQTAEMVERTNRAVDWQAEHLHEAPVLIFPAMAGCRAALEHPVFGRSVNGQVWVAIQNLMLGCRAVGLGAAITTLHLVFEEEVDRLLGLPPDAATFAMIPVGYPLGRFGPTRSVPLDTAVAWDRWRA